MFHSDVLHGGPVSLRQLVLLDSVHFLPGSESVPDASGPVVANGRRTEAIRQPNGDGIQPRPLGGLRRRVRVSVGERSPAATQESSSESELLSMGTDDPARQSRYFLHTVRLVEIVGPKSRHLPETPDEACYATHSARPGSSGSFHIDPGDSRSDPHIGTIQQENAPISNNDQRLSLDDPFHSGSKPTLLDFPLHQATLSVQRAVPVLPASQFSR